jgi:hypothetical protein
MPRVRYALVTAMIAALLLPAVTTAKGEHSKGPIAGAAADADRVVHFRDTAGPSTNVYEPCGATETVTVTVHGTEFYDNGGAYTRSLVHYFCDSVVTGPTGKSIHLDAHQDQAITAAGINTLTGQGANVRGPGLLYQDVGRVVLDISVPFPGQTLFASAKAVSFEAFDPDKLATAICAAVG